MKKAFLALACATSLLVPLYPGFAIAEEASRVKARVLQVSRQGDVDLECGALSQEAAVMRDIILTTQEIKDYSRLKKYGVNAAGAAASFLVGSLTGGVGVAAASFLIDYNIGENAQEAYEVQSIAAQRRALMAGIYSAKGCYGPLDHAMRDQLPPAPEERGASTRMAELSPASGFGTDRPYYNQ